MDLLFAPLQKGLELRFRREFALTIEHEAAFGEAGSRSGGNEDKDKDRRQDVADQCQEISLAERSRLCISIEDDGRGLPPVLAQGGDGLNNLRQRMAQIGGQCDIVNRPSGGVAVNLSLLLAP